MRYYPVFLDVRDRHCLVIGGGRVGTRKVKTLMACGARVTVISPEPTEAISEWAARKQVVLKRRAYRSSDLDDAFLVIGATDDEALNQRVHQDAEQRGRLCNIADQPRRCNFILPSVVNRGDLTVAVSTAGSSPAFAKHLRRELEQQFGPEYEALLTLLGAVRKRLLAEAHDPEAHKPMFERLIQGGLLDMLKAGDHQGVDRLLAKVLGPGYEFNELVSS